MPGVDTLQNFQWKRFSFTHNILTSYFNRFITDPELAPEVVHVWKNESGSEEI